MKRQSVPLPAWLPENALKPRIAGTGVNSLSARLEVDAVSAVFVQDPEVDLFLAQGSISNPRVFARLQIGEGAQPVRHSFSDGGSPHAARTCLNPKVYFRPRSRHVLDFGNKPDREDPTSPTLLRKTCRQKAMSDRQRSLPGDGAALIPRKERLVSLLVVCLFWACEK